MLQEADVESRVVNNEFSVFQKLEQLVDNFGKSRLRLEIGAADAVHALCTLVDSRSGFRKRDNSRPVKRRLTSSIQPISMMRWPCAVDRPVVSVSSTICRICSFPPQRRYYRVL